MEHRPEQEPSAFESAVTSLRAVRAVHSDDVVTQDTGQKLVNFNGFQMISETTLWWS